MIFHPEDKGVLSVTGEHGFIGYIWERDGRHLFFHLEEAYDPNGATPDDLRAIADKCEELDNK